MSAHLALFPKGFKGEKYRATDGAVFVCAEGSGTTTVDGKVLEWGPNDAVEGLRPHRRERVGAVLDLRPSFPGGARDLARGRQPALGRGLISAQSMRINARLMNAYDRIIDPQ
jgi:hypothetical protein